MCNPFYMGRSLEKQINMKIGIVIPSYNQGKYIEAALKSVIANKRNADIQIAVMDGGSKDETISIIRKYESELTFWCSEADAGQADAINKGIQVLSECHYYMWLNSDDIYENEYAVQLIADYAEKNHYEVCYGLSHFVNENGETIGEYPVETYSKEALGDRCYLSQPSVLFSKAAYLRVGPINADLKMCLDYEYWIRLSKEYTFGYIPEYIGCTRMYSETKTATMQQQHLKEAFQILMKYYGDVPMQWVVTKYLADHPGSIWRILPKRVLKRVLLPIKKSVVANSLREEKNA